VEYRKNDLKVLKENHEKIEDLSKSIVANQPLIEELQQSVKAKIENLGKSKNTIAQEIQEAYDNDI